MTGRVYEKYLWPFWGAAIAVALAHMHFQSTHVPAQSSTRHAHLLLERLETKTSSLESDLENLASESKQSPQIATQIVELQIELQDLNDQILEMYVGANTKKEERPLETRVEALEHQVKALVQRSDPAD